MTKEFSPGICDERHKRIDADCEDAKTKINLLENKMDKHLEKIYGHIEKLGDMMMHRLPPWVTAVIGILMGLIGVLAGIHFAH